MRKFVGLSISLLISFSGFTQILDDSTELVYGPETTFFTTHDEILNNQPNYREVDTAIYLFERKSIVDRSGRRYQNLGSFGTALFPIFHDPPKLIGRTSGFKAYLPYFRDTDQIRFYDTKSPFIDLYVYLGGGNQNGVHVDFSRNVREGWNVGFDLHNATTDKQLANSGEADRQVIGTSFDIYTHYKHKKVPYQAVLYYSTMSHKAVELGGVRFGPDSTLAELFQFNNALLRRIDANGIVRKNQWFLSHDYQIAKQFQLYHILNYEDEENTYQDFVDGTFTGYDPYRDAYNGVFQIDPDSTQERATFSSFSNEVGIKGNLGSVFYRGFVRLRTVDFNYFLLDPVDQTTEAYIGGYARFNWSDKFQVDAQGEFLQGGEYQLAGNISSKLINVSYKTMKYNVPFLYNNYFGNHYEWSNNFTPVFVNQLTGDIRLRYKAFTFVPKINLTAYTDYVFFNENRTPSQASSGIAIASVGADINVGFPNKKGEGVYFENEILANNVSGGSADAIRIPDIFYNGRYYWRGLLFQDKVPVEIGLDTHARSSYFANGYEALFQQFYIQNELEVTGYYKADFFFNMKLDKFFFALKWQYINQPSDGGYFATPYFPGQPRVLDLIIRWMFFD